MNSKLVALLAQVLALGVVATAQAQAADPPERPFSIVKSDPSLDSLRLEKAYRLWGADMSPDWTPLQAGLERFVAMDKGDFLGREALLRERERGSTHTLCCLHVQATVADAHGYEPIWADRDTPVGYVASGGYGHTIAKSLALAYLPVAYAGVGTSLQLTIHGERRPARVTEQPLFDPAGTRLLG